MAHKFSKKRKKRPKMCSCSFIELPNTTATWPCEYLLTKFIFLCVFGGFLILYVLLSSQINYFIMFKLSMLAIAFEIVAVGTALLYVFGAMLLGCELLSSILVCLCMPVIFPLLDRARARGVVNYHELDRSFISSLLLYIALREAIAMLWTFYFWNDDVNEQQQPPADAELRQNIMIVMDTGRCVMNIV